MIPAAGNAHTPGLCSTYRPDQVEGAAVVYRRVVDDILVAVAAMKGQRRLPRCAPAASRCCTQ